jgi:phosphinothricin acetyltransferase
MDVKKSAPQWSIRLAEAKDLQAISDIYNHYVLTCTCTYETEPETIADRVKWFAQHDTAHPVTVAEIAGEVVGWASLSPFASRSAYRNTVENSVYVRSDIHGRGIGKGLLADLIERAKAAGHHTTIAAISADQEASIGLHARMGFTKAAHLHEVGFKFDKWLDVIYMQLMLETP